MMKTKTSQKKASKKHTTMKNDQAECYAVDSHPMDSRFELEGSISPTVTSKLAKGSADGPLVLIKNG